MPDELTPKFPGNNKNIYLQRIICYLAYRGFLRPIVCFRLLFDSVSFCIVDR